MTASFDRIVVIFNPQSSGDGPQLADELRADLARRVPDVPVHLCPTERAGHARNLAREAARTGHPLIVSVSGDGGYNEVVDGVMQAEMAAAFAHSFWWAFGIAAITLVPAVLVRER